MRLVLCYHRVADPQPWSTSGIHTNPQVFEQQLEFLASHFRVMTLQHLLADPLADGVAITFDDGYRDNVHVAAPVLASAGHPATFFIASRYIDRQIPFYWDAIDFLSRRQTRSLQPQEIRDFVGTRRGISRWHMIQALGDAATRAGFPESDLPMTRSMLATLTRLGDFELGNHSATHPSLGSLSSGEQRSEIRECEDFLNSVSTRRAPALAFPFGRFRDRCPCPGDAPQLRWSFTTEPATVRDGAVRNVPRLVIGNDTTAQLARRIDQAEARQRRSRLYLARSAVAEGVRRVAKSRTAHESELQKSLSELCQ